MDTDRIFVSDRAHLVFPWHKELDRLSEEAAGAGSIGTTRKGIGPCYMDKAERSGLRVCDMLDEATFRDKMLRQARAKNEIIEKIYGGKPLDAAEIVERYAGYASELRPRVADTAVMIYDAAAEGKTILFEGAQGVMLDIDFGTYPYVTASHPGTGGFVVGAGVSPHMIGEVVGIVKAYTTRVGSGPMATELLDAVGDRIREAGNEYGTTTGRPRRCGWFDGVVVRHSARANGATGLSLMLLDVLDDFDEIKICYSYEADGQIIEHFPASVELLDRCKPLYKTLPGWKTDLTGCRSYDALPAETKAYVSEIESISGTPVKIISVGPGRDQTIIREKIF